MAHFTSSASSPSASTQHTREHIYLTDAEVQAAIQAARGTQSHDTFGIQGQSSAAGPALQPITPPAARASHSTSFAEQAFFGDMSRETSEAILAKNALMPGQFMLRNSESQPNHFILAYRGTDQRLHHMKFDHMPSDVEIRRNINANPIIPLNFSASGMRNDITTKEEARSAFDTGGEGVGSFLIRASQSSPGDSILCVLTTNGIKNIQFTYPPTNAEILVEVQKYAPEAVPSPCA